MSLKMLHPTEAASDLGKRRISCPGIKTNASLDIASKTVYYFYNAFTFQTSVTCDSTKQVCLPCFSNLSRSSILSMPFEASRTDPSLAATKISFKMSLTY